MTCSLFHWYLALSTLLWSSQPAFSQDELTILPSGATHTRAIDETILFTCSAPEGTGSTPQLKWIDNTGKEVVDTEDSARVSVEKDDPTTLKLYITQIVKADEGEYKCEAITPPGEKLVKLVELKLYKDITFTDAAVKQHPVIYKNQIIKCRVEGNPEPRVSWRYKNSKITTGGRYTVTPEGLEITNITQADDGIYDCRAEVLEDGRFDERKISVIVHIPPKITMELGEDNEGVENKTAELSCQANGLPPAKYEFFKDNSLRPVASDERIKVDAVNGILKFNPVMRSDDGKYKCRAINDAGQDETEGTLTVNVPPKILVFEDATKPEKQQVTLSCTAEGNPTTVMSFRKEGNDKPYQIGLSEDQRVRVISSANKLELVIDSLLYSDSDNYTCSAENKAGSSEASANLKVLFGPRFPEQESVFYGWADNKRNITCKTMAEPAPTFQWRHNGKVVTVPRENNDTFQIFNEGKTSHLQVLVKEEDINWIFNMYECLPSNQYGTDKKEFELKRAIVPSQPKKVEVVDQSPTSVTLSIEPPEDFGGVPVLGYRIDYDREPLIFDMKIENGESNQTTLAEIKNLIPSNNYEFRVMARNAVGVGSSTIVQHTTDSMSKPKPIKIVEQRQADTAKDVTVEWEAPRTGGSPIEKYKFCYVELKYPDAVPKGEEKCENMKDNKDDPKMEHKLKNLKPNTEYRVVMTAVNAIGESEASEPMYFRTAKGSSNDASLMGAGLSTPGIVGIIIALFILFLIIVDVACYFVNNCGVTKCICVTVCGEAEHPPDQKLVDAEKGEGADNKTVPVEEPKLACETETSPVQAASQDMEPADSQEQEEIPATTMGEQADTNNEDDADDVDENTPLARNEAKC